MSFWRLFYQVGWAIRERDPSIDDGRTVVLERAIRSACNDHDFIVHALFLMPDHVPLAASIPPRVAISDLMQRFKGTSSHLLNQVEADGGTPYAWQGGYGVLSLGERSLPDVVAYVRNQRARHAATEIRPLFEKTERPRPLATDDLSPERAS